MIRLSFLFISLLGFTSCFSQASENTNETITFYKNEWFHKRVKNSKFKQIEYLNEKNQNVTIRINTKTNDTLAIQYKLNGKPVGIWKRKDEYRNKIITTDFTQLIYWKREKDSKFELKPDVMAVYHPTDSLGFKFISQNTIYPAQARDAGASGTIYVRFMVDKLGNSSFVHIIKGADPFLDAEAVRVINLLEKWHSPAYLNNESVDAYFVIPVIFRLR